MRTMALLLIGAFTAACTDTKDVVPSQPASTRVVPNERCDALVRAALADARLDDTLTDVDIAVREAAELRRRRPPAAPRPLDVLADELARLHEKVDTDMNRLAAARETWNAMKHALEVDVIALDQAISEFERADD